MKKKTQIKETTEEKFVINVKGIESQNIDKSFGRPEDFIELHIIDSQNNLILSEYNFKDFSMMDEGNIPPSSIMSPTSKEPEIVDESAKGAGEKDYKSPGPNNAIDGYWFNTGAELIWVSEISTNTNLPLPDGITSTLSLNLKKILTSRGYLTGKYKLKFNILRNKIFNSQDNPFIIKQISPSRKEIKAISPQISNETFSPAVNAFIYEIESSAYFRDFTLNFSNDTTITGINVLLNQNSSKHELYIKLLDPLPKSISNRREFKLVEFISDPVTYEIDLGLPDIIDSSIKLRGPNYKIDLRQNNSVPSCFHNYNQLLDYNLTSSYQNLLNHLEHHEIPEISYDYIRPISSSTEGLDIPYHFENFVHFSSATERLKNFEYKLKLIELYNFKLNNINLISSNTLNTTAVISDKNTLNDKKTEVLKGLDGYERFLYYESGNFSWPKTTTTTPHELYHTTSSEAKTWLGNDNDLTPFYGGQLLSASLFDSYNPYSLSNLIPAHIKDNSDNNLYTSFNHMIGQHFDQIWTHIKHITEVKNTHHERGVSKDLVFYALKSLGIETFDQFENTNLIEYILGEGTSGSAFYSPPVSQSFITASNKGSIPKGDIAKEVWKRLYHNAPYLLKTKGTERGIRALMSCYGVPSTILNIKEYGGSTSDKTTYQTFSYDKSSHALKGTAGDNGYYIKTKWSSSLTDNISSSAKSITFRIKPTRSDNNYHLFNLSSSVGEHDPILILNTFTGGNDISSSGDSSSYGQLDLYTGSAVVASTTKFPIFDGNYWNIFIGTDGTSGSASSIKFGAYKSNYLKNILYYTSSVAFGSENNRALTFGDPYLEGHNSGGATWAYIGGMESSSNSAYDDLDTLSYSGSIQEVVFHFHQSSSFETISHDNLKKQALAPFIYAGNNPSSSFNDVVLRLPLGSSLHKNSSSFHPNIDIDYLGVGEGVSSSMQSQEWTSIEEVHHLLTPDTVGASTTSEKVRIDSGSVDDNILSPTERGETSTLDRQPQDFEDLGVFFSPTNEINEDIIYTLGAFRMDDYIGSPLPHHQTSSQYTDLTELRELYVKKIKSRFNYWDYIKLIQYTDHTLFKIIEQWVPFKSNLKTGLLIEPNYLERNKFPINSWPKTDDGTTMVPGSYQTINVGITSNTSSKADKFEGNKLLSIHSKVGGGNVVTTNNFNIHGKHAGPTGSNGKRTEQGTNFTITVNPIIPLQEHAQAPIIPNSTGSRQIKRISDTLLGNIQEGVKSRRYYSSLAIGNQNNLFENN